MKRFVSAVCLCLCLLVSGLFLLSPASDAQDNVLESLINLPAPPAQNPFFEGARRRAENFFSKNNPPPDDAPIEDLIAYWQAQNQFDPDFGYTVKPSEKTLERLLEEIEKKPEDLLGFLNVLRDKPAAADLVKRLYERELSGKNIDEDWRESVKEWLTLNSDYFINDLVEMAQETADTGEYVSSQAELRALARVDWERARPILDRLLNDASQPVSQTLARWIYYERALREGDIGDTDKYRKLLQETVEDKNAKPGNRDLALDALVAGGDFPGRDDWYYSLLADETLYDLRVGGSTHTSLTTLLNHSPPDKYREKMIELVKSSNQTIRNAAARNLGTLLDEKDPDVIRALLPWLENADWAKEVDDERQAIVTALQSVQIPESVPGLIAMLNEKERKREQKEEVIEETRSDDLSNSNTSIPSLPTNTSMNSNVISIASVNSSGDAYPYRYGAISALITQKDGRAAPALRLLLPQVQGYERSQIVMALLRSNGFSVSEQIDALESVTKSRSYQNSNTNIISNAVPGMTPGTGSSNMIIPMANVTRRTNVITVLGNTSVGNYNTSYTVNTNSWSQPYNPNETKNLLGNLIISEKEPGGELVTNLVDRIETLESKDRATAQALRAVMKGWRGAAINSLMLRDLKTGSADAETIVKLLSVRRELREKQSAEIYEARSGGGANQTAFGISACLFEDPNEYNAILSGGNVESKIALLGCARLIRASLPVQAVAANLKSPNKLLALAAERYLESEDSEEARAVVLSLYPNDVKILGAKTYFAAGDTYALGTPYLAELFANVNSAFLPENQDLPFDVYTEGYDYIETVEKSLRQEIALDEELLGVYAYDKNFIRIFKDKAVFSWEENASRYRERDLSKEEFEGIKSYLAAQRAGELPPFLSYSDEEYIERELLMLGRAGGRRVFLRAEKMPRFFAELDSMFEAMRKPPARLRYALEKDVAGLEILFADEILQARTVWKNGADFRVLIDDTERRKRIDKELDLLDKADESKAEEEEGNYEKLLETMRKRREQRKYENFSWHKLERNKLSGLADQPSPVEFLPPGGGLAAQASSGQWKARTPTFEIRAGSDGLYKFSRGALTKIKAGNYFSPVVTADGRWVIAAKPEEDEQNVLVRINLLTGREYKINLGTYPTTEAVAFIPSLSRVLLSGSYYSSYEEEAKRVGMYFLLDAETGTITEAGDEIRPLAQQTFRPLQSSGAANEFWAAVPDYDENQTQVGIFNDKTMSFKPLLTIPKIKFYSMNMWIDAGKVYFVFEGHVLSLPLGKG